MKRHLRVEKFTTSGPQSWNDEYRKLGIPSSVRGEPSGSVVEFVKYMSENKHECRQIVDVGAGTGRNSLYLVSLGFRVTALDFASSQTGALRNHIREGGILDLFAFEHDVRNSWPVEYQSQDAAIDAFCFKHQIGSEDVARYVANAAEALRPGALMMISFAGRGDGYYSRFPVEQRGGSGLIVLDPGNDILSRLYDIREVLELFSPFEPVFTKTKEARNTMHGGVYDRQTHIVYLKRR